MARILTHSWRIAALVLAVFVTGTALGAPPPLHSRRVALVVGNGGYQHLPQLANPPNDATLVARTLHDLGFVLVGGGPLLNLDKAGFDRAVQNFGAELQTADVGLFYYSGHGLQVQGTNWLVPVAPIPLVRRISTSRWSTPTSCSGRCSSQRPGSTS